MTVFVMTGLKMNDEAGSLVRLPHSWLELVEWPVVVETSVYNPLPPSRKLSAGRVLTGEPVLNPLKSRRFDPWWIWKPFSFVSLRLAAG